jgi:starch phosphorylase
MKPIRTFNVSPAIPPQLAALPELAYNLYWDWNNEIKSLFRRVDRELWETTRHNPVALLSQVSQSRLQELADDAGFLAQLDRAKQLMADYPAACDWYKHQHRPATDVRECYAYFCAEFGLVDCLPIYSGGLGVLAGDHLKSASDLGLPLVGVGLLYQKGYFAQYLNADGWQQERYPHNDFYNMPLSLERQSDGSEVRVAVEFPGRVVYARIWRVQVGNVPLYLLDTNIEPNNEADQDITDELYGGDIILRMQQEMILGIGGCRALKALGYEPTAYHMNEGHSGFLILERIREYIQAEKLTFSAAKQMAMSTQLFTTHTPVTAGFDRFDPDVTVQYVGHYADVFGISREEFLSLGREQSGNFTEKFSMAGLAMRTASFVNGVAQLHGHVSRVMFRDLWPNFPLEEVPITAITNGVHARSCVSSNLQGLYDRYLGSEWSSCGIKDHLWDLVNSIPDEELWREKNRCRDEMVAFARKRILQHLHDRSAAPVEINRAREALDPNVLTIGFARRFATYKRATLFLRNVDRLKRILSGNPDRRVQFVIAGKAHPKDNPGKELIRDILRFIHNEGLSSIVFIPDYDIYVSRILVAGCDVWLNTPRRPREASGTSGMKAAANGSPNLSILDGWWDEADYSATGWAIGNREEYREDEANYQDEVEANALYELIEDRVVPSFYERDREGVPRQWLAKMKSAIQLNTPKFNTARMVADYAMQGYFPASDRYAKLHANNFQLAKDIAAWKSYLLEHWYGIRLEDINADVSNEIKVGESIHVDCRLYLGQLNPSDVQVQVYHGHTNSRGEIEAAQTTTMAAAVKDDRGYCAYAGKVTYNASGLQGLSVRVLPDPSRLSNPQELGLVVWA